MNSSGYNEVNYEELGELVKQVSIKATFLQCSQMCGVLLNQHCIQSNSYLRELNMNNSLSINCQGAMNIAPTANERTNSSIAESLQFNPHQILTK